MSFTRYACWQADRVNAVMNPDAEHIADDVFLAVHSDHDLILVDPGARNVGAQQWSSRERWTVAPSQFVTDFLSPDRREARAAVLGASGSGKSHFIRWLALNIPQRDDLYVLSIPKTGTNLRGVLERIIAVLPADDAVAYREALNAAGYSNATREQRRERLLSEIALAIGGLTVRPDDPDIEAEEWLIAELPKLFNDPYYRSTLSQSQSIIEQLVDHISEPPRAYERRNERRAFQLNDLPLTGVALTKLSAPAQECISALLSAPEYAPLAINIINRSLNTAISGVLNFRGERLQELMLEVRRYLRAQGKTLALLIEDFARLQGIDAALLQALIEAPGDGPDSLCDLRWAMAVTRGYYEQLPDTVKTRMDFLIDMDLPLDALGTGNVTSFAQRYLNAVRLRPDQLAGWYERGAATGTREAIPNRCDECLYREECHASFGSVEGVGLYPFNAAALDTMALRKDPDIRDRFNPRRFIKMVLAEVMGTRRQELVDGAFPDARLLDSMGGSQLTPTIEDRLKRDNPVDFERQRTVLELWGTPGQPSELPDGVYTAFALKPPKVQRSTESATALSSSDVSAVSSATAVQRQAGVFTTQATFSSIDTGLQAIRRWAQGGIMPQDVAQILRDHLYAALESYIDWDAERLERGSFMQRTGAASIPFRSRSIVFLRQQTVESASIVKLKLPMDPSEGNDQLRTAIALSALWQFNSTKSWDFPDAFEGLVALGECLAQWSAALLAQFKHMPGSESGWDAVDTAVEALAVGAALAGKMSSSRLTLTEKLNVIFEPLPDRLHELAIKEWEKLYYDIRTHADKYQALIRAWASATKGGRVGAMINPQLVLPPLKRILRGWQVSSSSPREADGLRDPYRQLARVHAAIRTRLPEVTRAEYERRMDWLGAIRQHMDENTLRMQVAEAARRMGQAISDEAIAVRPSIRREFDEALVQFAAANQLDNAVRAAQQLHDLPDPTTQLEALFPGRGAPALIIATRFFGAADALIREAEAAIETKRTSLDAEVNEGFRRDHQIIVESLETIQHALNVIGGTA